MNLLNLIIYFITSLLPGVEPRYVFPFLVKEYGLMPAFLISLLAILTLSFFVPIFYEFLDAIFTRLLGDFWSEKRDSARKNLKDLVSRYGTLGLVLFVAVPLPMTGIWTGGIVARFIGLDLRNTFIGCFFGGVLSLVFVYLMTFSIL